LFLYGGVGLGKTHLLHAIGHVGQAHGLQVLYLPAEDFTNRLINAIRTKTTDTFRDRYRNTDILLIDDIQFIAGKESTQEEFFHTFNALHGQEKQLVLSSDRPPKAMVTLEERLRSRFEWGLIVDIQPPDLETRIAILRAKSLALHASIPDAVIERLARQVQSNIRELEGALNRILAWTRLTGQAITPGLADTVLADLLPQRQKRTIDQVIEVVADHYGVSIDELKGPNRHQRLAVPRQVAMYLAREEASASLPQIGNVLGNRDHTTVLYGCEKIADLAERDNEMRRTLVSLRERLYNS
jgi:chromosomal replication initiator protein